MDRFKVSNSSFSLSITTLYIPVWIDLKLVKSTTDDLKRALHSSMDRFKDSSVVAKENSSVALHSSMDRFKDINNN